MSELRQRRNISSGAVASSVVDDEVAVSANQHKSQDTRIIKQQHHHHLSPRPPSSSRTTHTKKLTSILLFFIYLLLIAVINPTTIPTIYYKYFPTKCQGICTLRDADRSSSNNIDHTRSNDKDKDTARLCTAIDPSRLIFLRLPKTGSTTLSKLFKSRSTIKSTRVIDLGEIENLVPSLPIDRVAGRAAVSSIGQKLPQGYYDPSPKAIQHLLIEFYKQSTSTIFMSSFKGRDRLIFDGHFRYYNWIQRGPKLLLSLSSSLGWKEHLPSFIQELYNIQSPQSTITRIQEEEQKYGGGIPTISMVRHPYERLASMYNYDRTKARNIYWRKDFISKRGNATLQECLLNSTCVEVNELKRWCNIQTEMLCGVDAECTTTTQLTKAALERAMYNIENEILFVGITERMNESVSLLEEVLLPTYLEGLGGVGNVRENVGRKNKEESFSNEAKKVLNEICTLDLQLYKYVDRLLTHRIRTCGVGW